MMITTGYDLKPVQAMTVGELRKALEDFDPDCKLAIEGAAGTAWAVGEAEGDELGAWVLLRPGPRLPDIVEED